MDSESNDETDLMLLETTDEDDDTFELDDLTLELTDCTTDFWTLSLTFELSDDDDSSETLDWKLSCTLFSAFDLRLDCTLPSTLDSLSSATLRCDLLALSTKPVAVFSQLDSDELSDDALDVRWTLPLWLTSESSILSFGSVFFNSLFVDLKSSH